jgi:Macroglobulin domain MG3
LPTYSVNVDLPQQVSIPEATFPVTVNAIYTFGETVEGEAVVTFYIYQRVYEILPIKVAVSLDQTVAAPLATSLAAPRKTRHAWWEGKPIKKILFVKTVKISSAAETFMVSIPNDLKSSSERYVYIEVVFTESLTKKTALATGYVYMSQYACELIVTGSDTYASGQPYSFTVSARKIGTGTPVSYIENRL